MSLPIATEPPRLLDTMEAQAAFFRANSYVLLPDVLTIEEVTALNRAMDRDQEQKVFQQFCPSNQRHQWHALLVEPCFELTIRHPRVLPLVERLMGGPLAFEELSIRHLAPSRASRPMQWHRDCSHWLEHPLHLEVLQVLYYLTDVDETTHCFTISPEPADGEVLDMDQQLARGGIVHFHGKAGSAIVCNASVLHGATIRQSARARRTVHAYYGHPQRPAFSEITLVPARLWRDHPDAAIRQFYGKNRSVLQPV